MNSDHPPRRNQQKMSREPPQRLGRHYVAATSASTPAFTPHFGGASDLIPYNSEEYDRLRHRACAINAELLREREDRPWRKSALTDIEQEGDDDVGS